MKNKVVINTCYGGFHLTEKAVKWMVLNGLEKEWYFENTDFDAKDYCGLFVQEYYLNYDIPRHHPLLVKVVEELGSEAEAQCSELGIVEIEGNKYRIIEYDGLENIETPTSINWIEI